MKKIIPVILLTVIAIFCSACATPLPYDATLADRAENFMKEEYLAENKTHSWGNNDDLPENICKIIKTEEEYERAFNSFPEETDFTEDVLVLYFFTDIYYGFDCKLQKITNSNGEITVEILHKMANKPWSGSASMPIQRCLAVKLTACGYTDISVILNY